MSKIGLVYGSDRGVTAEAAEIMADKFTASEIELIDATDVEVADFERFDKFILALSTWHSGELQSDWETFYDNGFQDIDFTGKTVAIFGLGDQYGYEDFFCDAIGILAEVVLNNGGKIIGKWSCEDYNFEASKAQIPDEKGFFYGLALDEDNEPEKSEKRIEKWLEQIEKEFGY